MRNIFKFTVLCVLFAGFHTLWAQEPIDRYGKNRIQYKTFKWRFYSTENFDIYFYDGGNDIAREAANFLEKEYDRITDVLGYAPYSKTKIFLYNSITDLQQSNVGISEKLLDIGGKTDFVKSQVEIAYPGTMDGFKQELVYQISKMLINDMMFGGSLSDMFQSAYLLSLPEWFMAGASRFVAQGWSVEMDDAIRDLIDERRAKRLARYTGEEAAVIGQSIWNFIAEAYGYSYLSNILNLTRIIRNEERSISGTLGVPFRDFLNAWVNFYTVQKNQVDAGYIYPEKNTMLIRNNRRNLEFKDVRISPDGRYLAYASNNEGRYKVHLIDFTKKRRQERVILRGGYKVINQEINRDHPLLSWRDDNTLGIVGNKFGRNQLWMYDVAGNNRLRKEMPMVNHINSFDIARDGNIAVMSADRNGVNDLYLISLRRNSIKRITSDFYDDIHPRFIPGTSSIVFSSNRSNDTIFHKGGSMENVGKDYNLFIYNIDTTKNVVKRVTNTLGKDIMPMAVNSNDIYYLSDIQGIFNLYKYNLSSGVFHQVTNFGSSIRDYDISFERDRFAFVMLRDERQRIFLKNDFNLDQNIFTPQTRRQQLINAKFVANRLKRAEERATQRSDQRIAPGTVTPSEESPRDLAPVKETFADFVSKKSDEEERIDTDNYVFGGRPSAPAVTQTPADTTERADAGTETQESTDSQDPPVEPTPGDERYVNTENYVFDTDVVRPSAQTGSFLSDFRRLRRRSDIIGPLPYQPRFSADNVITNFVVDPLLGFGINLQAQLNDELEDHRFLGGTLISTDLRSGNFYGEYRYLRHTVDFGTRFDRRSITRNVENGAQKYTLNKFEVSASLPISVTSRITAAPFFAQYNYVDTDQSLIISLTPSGNQGLNAVRFGGFRAEYTFDNTSTEGLNLIQGTRGRVSYVNYQGLNDITRSFSNVSLDFRTYQPIHREITLAGRLFYGRFLGNRTPKYLLGGMDNWLFNRTNITGEGDPLILRAATENNLFLFNEFVTNLRGFDLNTFNGENSLLLNLELRLPIVKYFYRAPITSNFLKNLQLIGFYDIGSAWTGPSPFATENSINTQTIRWEGSSFEARIKNFKNPWLSSYGAGLRTVMLGYYVKFDLAYPIEDYEVQRPRFYVSLGYDF